MPDYTDKAERMRVLWRRGRDMYTSFFTELDAVRAEIGDAALADWCFDHLRIGLENCYNARRFLREGDAKRVRDDLRRARDAAPTTPPPPAECVVCGEPFLAERSTRRYCSDRCRVAAYRARR